MWEDINMKILYLAEKYPYPATTGISLISSQLLKNLSPADFEIDLWYLAEKKAPESSEFHCITKSLFFKIDKASLIKYYFSDESLPWGMLKYYSAGLKQKLAVTDLANKYDFVYLDSPFLAFYKKYITDLPIILNSVDDIQAWFQQSKKSATSALRRWHFKQENKKYANFEKNYFSKFSKLIFVADKDRLGVINRGLDENKTLTIPLGVDTEYFQPQENKTPPAIITTGNMAYLPNQEGVSYFAKNIWSKLSRRNPELKWYIVGKDPSPKIQQLMKNKNIIVTGFVEDMREYFAKAQIVVSPLQSGTGTKIKILEALALGKAIVASKPSIDGIPELTGEELLIAKNPDEYINFIERLLTDARIRAEYQARARQFIIENYSWKKSINLYEEIFKNYA